MAEDVAAGSEAHPTTGISKRVYSLVEWDHTHPIKVRAHFLQRSRFELTHPLARNTEFFCDFDQCAVSPIPNAKAQGDNRTFTGIQRGERSLQFFTEEISPLKNVLRKLIS